MVLVPYKTFHVQSKLTLEEAYRRIAETVDTRRWFLRSEKYFRGEITPESFRLIPATRERNTYLPVIRGHFELGPEGTEVEGTFSLHPVAVTSVAVLAIGPFWLGTSKGDSRGALIWLAVLLAFHTVLYFWGFLPEVKRAESLLRDLLGDYR